MKLSQTILTTLTLLAAATASYGQCTWTDTGTRLEANCGVIVGQSGSIAKIEGHPGNSRFNIKNLSSTSAMAINFGGSLEVREGNGGGSIVMRFIDGKMGIGTISPQSKLAVNGTITAQEVVVTQDGWPDYVFQDGYDLMPLGALEARIQEDGHLPGIPSADEAAENGVGVGEMQAKLLEKVEELTLYMIALQKENEDLKSRLDNIEGSK